jgi:urease accessory protein
MTECSAVMAKDGVLADVRSGPPLSIRKVRDADPMLCHLCLVGSAAGPLTGDAISLEVTVLDGAVARLSASGAGLAQGRRAGSRGALEPPSTLRTTVHVGADARLDARPPPLIVSATGSVDVGLSIDLAGSATLCWRELLVLGRHGEPAGDAILRWSVYRDGLPLLVQTLDLRDDRTRGWAGLLDGTRVIVQALITGPGVQARTLVDSAHAVCQAVDGNTALITVLDRDAAAAEHGIQSLLAALGR